MFERIRAVLRALSRRVRRLLLRGARCTPASRRRSRRRSSASTRPGGCTAREGALWLRTTEFGDDKDRVLVRSTGQTTYFAADVAYLADKLERGFDRLILPLGADHHGYLARMRAALAALDADPDCLEMPILQFVHVIERGERSKMSKRRGDFVTLEELIDSIGVDAARFFMLQRSHDTTVDLDLDLAREQSSENPVYYVQYAHARIASILAKAGEERVARGARGGRRDGDGARAVRARADQEAAGVRRGGRGGGRCGARRTGSPPTCSSSRRRSRPSTATARSLGAEGEGVESFRLALGRRREAHDRALAGPARRQRAGGDVSAAQS